MVFLQYRQIGHRTKIIFGDIEFPIIEKIQVKNTTEIKVIFFTQPGSTPYLPLFFKFIDQKILPIFCGLNTLKNVNSQHMLSYSRFNFASDKKLLRSSLNERVRGKKNLALYIIMKDLDLIYKFLTAFCPLKALGILRGHDRLSLFY